MDTQCVSIFLFLSLFTISFQAQTVFWTESFSSGSAARATAAHNYPADMGGTWSQTDIGAQGSAANAWYISAEECGTPAGLCGSACPNNNASLHVSAVGGLCGIPDCGAAYDASAATNITHKRIYSPLIDCGNYQNVSLSFDYIAAQGDLPQDQVKVVYSCDGGMTWQDLPGGSPLAASNCCLCSDPFLCLFVNICCGGFGTCTGLDQGLWTQITIPFPACVNNNRMLRFGFEWQNDGNGIGTDPSFAVDDIELRYDFFLPEIKLSFEVESQGEKLIFAGNSNAWQADHQLILEKWTPATGFQAVKRFASPQITLTQLETEPGFHWYQLTQVDFSGSRLASTWQEIFVESEKSFTLSVFARRQSIELTFSEALPSCMIEIYDVNGKKILRQFSTFDSPTHRMNMEFAASKGGIYFLRLGALDGGLLITKRFTMW